MDIFERILGKKRPTCVQKSSEPEQAVLVYINGSDLPAEVYRDYDLGTIQDKLRKVIKQGGLGEFDGNAIGPTEAILYMYGPDAERLFAGIEQILRDYPLCKGARVVIRRGGPGAEQRDVTL